MYIIVYICCISHILKAAQQVPFPHIFVEIGKLGVLNFQSLVVIFSLNGTIDRSMYETLLWPTVSCFCYRTETGSCVQNQIKSCLCTVIEYFAAQHTY